MTRQRKKYKNNYKQNHGIPGVVYILDNPGLKEGMLKIGCSRRSGKARAGDLNFDATTGTPGTFRCVFEYRTKDCGKAEVRVFEKLNQYRRGKWGQEYFEVALEFAKETIAQVCTVVDSETEKYSPPPNTIQVGDSGKAKLDSIPITNAPPIVSTATSRGPATQLSHKVRWFWGVGIMMVILIGIGNFGKKESSSHPPKAAYSPPQTDVPVSRVGGMVTNVPESHPPKAAYSPPQTDVPVSRDGKDGAPAVASLEGAPRNLDMSNLTRGEKSSIESVCSNAKYLKGPAAYNKCISQQLASLEGAPRNLDMSNLTRGEKSSIESVCSNAKYLKGPAAYNKCISQQLASLEGVRH